MKALRTRLRQVGNSTVISIPPPVARLFRWEPGLLVRALLVEGGEPFERKLLSLYGGKGVGLTVPAAVLDAAGVERGADVDVPFHEWEPLAAPKPPAKKPKARAAR